MEIKKKDKKKIIIFAIIGLIFLFLLFGNLKEKDIIGGASSGGGFIPGLTNNNPTSSSGGGATSTSTPAEEDYTGWSFPDFSDLFDWEVPCFWNCGDSDETTEESTEESTELITEADLSDYSFENCRFDSDCQNYCSDPNDAKCIDGDCSCAQETEDTSALFCSDGDKSLADRDTSVYEIKGTCTEGLYDRGVTDYCSRGMLIEYYCRTDTACASIEINCAEQLNNPDAFCYDGACTWLA